MLAIGCIQAQRCHTDRCPTGVATQSRWLMRGLDPGMKSVRAANYITALRGELMSLTRSCGVRHPALLAPDHIEIVSERYRTSRVAEVFGYEAQWRRISPERRAEIEALIGPGVKRTRPGQEAGPIMGDESGTRPPEAAPADLADPRGAGEPASESG
jgi:hypothetical protein